MTDLKTYQAALDRAIRAGETRAQFEAFIAAGGTQRIHFVIDGDDAAARAINHVWATKHGFDYILKYTLDALVLAENRMLAAFQEQVTTDSLAQVAADAVAQEGVTEPAKDYAEAAE